MVTIFLYSIIFKDYLPKSPAPGLREQIFLLQHRLTTLASHIKMTNLPRKAASIWKIQKTLSFFVFFLNKIIIFPRPNTYKMEAKEKSAKIQIASLLRSKMYIN